MEGSTHARNAHPTIIIGDWPIFSLFLLKKDENYHACV